MAYLVVTIDVEPDCTPDWTYSNPLTFNGVTIGIKNILQPLFNKYDIIPTYLINNVVLEDDESVKMFNELEGRFELGTHLHPEFIEPRKSVFNYAGSKGEANCCHYDTEVEFEKINNITKLFIRQFGYSPTSFRAGRFSASNNTFSSLSKLGYKVDTSITPGVCWKDKTRRYPVDFSDYDHNSFWLDDNLLEVPVTILKKNNFSLKEFIKSGFGIVRKPRFYTTQWLRPVFSNTDKLIEIVKSIDSNKDEISVLNLMFHNVEVMPNLSPYCRSQTDCNNYLESLDKLFLFCKSRNIESINISNLHDLYKKSTN